MSRHILVVTVDEEYSKRFPDFPVTHKWTIECPDGNGCAGIIECDEEHPLGANEGPDDSEESDPWYGHETFTFHGEEHTWDYFNAHGWTVAYKGCVVAGHPDIDPPDDLWGRDEHGDQQLPLGRWIIEDDWDDLYLSLELVGPQA